MIALLIALGVTALFAVFDGMAISLAVLFLFGYAAAQYLNQGVGGLLIFICLCVCAAHISSALGAAILIMIWVGAARSWAEC